MLGFTFSRRLAIIGGLLLPVLEIVRRWRTLPGPIETWPYWLDDFVIGGLLVAGAVMSRLRVGRYDGHNVATMWRNPGWLSAAWGFALGMGIASTLSQYSHIVNPDLGEDPSGVAHIWVLLIKLGLCGIAVLGLVTSVRGDASRSPSA